MLIIVAVYVILSALRGHSRRTKLLTAIALLTGYGLLWLFGSDASPLHETFENSRPSDL